MSCLLGRGGYQVFLYLAILKEGKFFPRQKVNKITHFNADCVLFMINIMEARDKSCHLIYDFNYHSRLKHSTFFVVKV